MLPPPMRTWCVLAGAILCFAFTAPLATAQWLNFSAPGIPRLPDGRPNLRAPAPRGS